MSQATAAHITRRTIFASAAVASTAAALTQIPHAEPSVVAEWRREIALWPTYEDQLQKIALAAVGVGLRPSDANGVLCMARGGGRRTVNFVFSKKVGEKWVGSIGEDGVLYSGRTA